LQGWTYRYYDSGDIKSITDEKAQRYEYIYDELHRLDGELIYTSAGVNNRQNRYKYDVKGNLKSRFEANTTVSPTNYEYFYKKDQPHVLDYIKIDGAKRSYGHDKSGNMTSGPNLGDGSDRTIIYGADGLPLSVTANGQSSYFRYDAFGERAVKEGDNGTTYYISPLYEETNGVATMYVTAGGIRIAKVVGGDIKYLHQNHLGSTTLVTNSSGGIVEKTEYTPFGNIRPPGENLTSTPYNYTGQEYDPETGLYYYHARYYDPLLGRFVSPDSVISNIHNPQALNPYSYCLNNPLKYTDPSGHISQEEGGNLQDHDNENFKIALDTVISSFFELGQLAFRTFELQRFAQRTINTKEFTVQVLAVNEALEFISATLHNHIFHGQRGRHPWGYYIKDLMWNEFVLQDLPWLVQLAAGDNDNPFTFVAVSTLSSGTQAVKGFWDYFDLSTEERSANPDLIVNACAQAATALAGIGYLVAPWLIHRYYNQVQQLP
jgi:RHS repeat-associated protein